MAVISNVKNTERFISDDFIGVCQVEPCKRKALAA